MLFGLQRMQVGIGLTFIVRKIVNVSKTIARGLHLT